MKKFIVAIMLILTMASCGFAQNITLESKSNRLMYLNTNSIQRHQDYISVDVITEAKERGKIGYMKMYLQYSPDFKNVRRSGGVYNEISGGHTSSFPVSSSDWEPIPNNSVTKKIISTLRKYAK